MTPALSFRAKLLGLGGAVLIAALCAMAIAHDQFMARVLERQLMTYVETTEPFLSAALATPLAARDYASIEAILEESVQTLGFSHKVLVDTSGRVISASGWDVGRHGLPEPTGKPVLAPSGEEVMLFKLSISYAGQTLGELYFGLSCKPLVDARLSMLGWSLLIVSISLVVAGGVLHLGQRWLMRPLKLLHDASEEIRHGRYDVAVAVPDRQEIGHLAEAFNVMAREIDRRVTELDEARRRAEDATRAKSDFLAVMSHELRTPMVAIVGAVDLLATTPLDAEQRHLADIALGSTTQLTDLIGNILDASKFESGAVALANVPFNLEELLDAVLRTTEIKARGKDIRIVGNIEPGVLLHRMGDPLRLRQVLSNLMINAVKFTDRGWVRLSIGPGAAQDAVAFSVADTGVGIAPGQQAKIFEKFVQVDQSSTRRVDGAGLGLAICRDLVSAMGGEIAVDSTLGQGSTFRFSAHLPVTDEEASTKAS